MAYEAQAKAAGDARFAGEERAILTAQQLAAIRAQAEQAALNQWGTTGREAIDQSFDALLADMARNRELAMGIITDQTNRVSQGYEDAARQNDLVRQESRNYLQSLMENYGLGQTVPDIQSSMENLTNQLIERNVRYGQDARTALGNWGARHDVLYGDAQTNAQGARAFQQSAFQSQLGNLLAQAQAAQREREIEFASALQGLAAQRGGFEVEYAQGLADRESDRNLRLAEMQMRANLEQAQLDAAASRFNAEQSYRNQDNAWDREKFYASLGLDTRKQDFAEWLAKQEQGSVDPWASGGILGQRQYEQITGIPGLTDRANQYLNQAMRDPRVQANPDNPALLGQVAIEGLRQPVAQYGKIGGGSGQPGQWERVRDYEQLLNSIAIRQGM